MGKRQKRSCPFNGVIDEVRVYKKALTEEERDMIFFIITADNGLQDCQGNTKNSQGTTAILYVSFPNRSTMTMHRKSKGGSPYAVFTRKE